MGAHHSKQNSRSSSRSSSATSSDLEEVVAQVGIVKAGRSRKDLKNKVGSSHKKDEECGEIEPQEEMLKGTITLHGGMPLGTDDGKYTSPVLLLKSGIDGLQHLDDDDINKKHPQPGKPHYMKLSQNVYKMEEDIVAIPVQDILSITAHAKVHAIHTTCKATLKEKRCRCCLCCRKPRVKEPVNGRAPSGSPAAPTYQTGGHQKRKRTCCACCKPEVVEHVETAEDELAFRQVVVVVEALDYSHVDTVSHPDYRLKHLMKSRALQMTKYNVALLSSKDSRDDAEFMHEVDAAAQLCVLITQLKSSAAAAENRWPSTDEIQELLSKTGLHKFGAKELREQRV